jgi:hypothetical protein
MHTNGGQKWHGQLDTQGQSQNVATPNTPAVFKPENNVIIMLKQSFKLKFL